MKTRSLMTLHALVSYVAIRMPDRKSHEISRLNINTGSKISAARTMLGASTRRAHHSGASPHHIRCVKVCKTAHGLPTAAF